MGTASKAITNSEDGNQSKQKASSNNNTSSVNQLILLVSSSDEGSDSMSDKGETLPKLNNVKNKNRDLQIVKIGILFYRNDMERDCLKHNITAGLWLT